MKKYALFFLVLILWTTPSYVYGIEPVENKASNSEHKAEEKPINNEPNEHEEDRDNIRKDTPKETSSMNTWRLQYTQLLEVHRSYFMAFLQVLAIYLAVMGACLKFVCDSIEKLKNGDKKGMKNGDKKGSRTVLFALITFAVLTSSLFLLGLRFGEVDAKERNGQIADVAKPLCIVKPVNTELITRLFAVMAIGTALIVVGWYIIFIRGLMAARKKLRWPLIIETGILLIYWLVVSLGYLQNLYFMILIGIVTPLIIIYWIVRLVQDRQKPLGTS